MLVTAGLAIGGRLLGHRALPRDSHAEFFEQVGNEQPNEFFEQVGNEQPNEGEGQKKE